MVLCASVCVLTCVCPCLYHACSRVLREYVGYVCMWACVRVCTLFAPVHVCVHVCGLVCVHVCVRGYVCAHTCVGVHARMCSLWTCVRVSTRVCRRTHYPWRSTLQRVLKEGHVFLGTELFLKASSVQGRLVPISDTHPRTDPCFLRTHTLDVCTGPCTLRLAAQCGLRGEGEGRVPAFLF